MVRKWGSMLARGHLRNHEYRIRRREGLGMGTIKWGLLILLLSATASWADITSHLNIRTTDGAVSNYPYQLKVTTGTLTDNGDGTMTLQTGGGSSSNISTCGSSPVGIQFTDTANCSWCETINTSGVLATALIACAATFILMEDGTYILQEDGTKIVVQ